MRIAICFSGQLRTTSPNIIKKINLKNYKKSHFGKK